MSDHIHSAFRKSRIYFALVFGVLVTLIVMGYSLTRSEFHAVDKGKGSYEWIDNNQNGKIDSSDPAEFKPSPHGDFEKKSASQILSEIQWTSTTVFWLSLAMVAMVGRDLGYMIRIRILTHKKLSWKQAFHVIAIWEFASALAPGIMSGAAVAMFILNKEKIELGRATAIVVLTAMLDNLFYVLIIPTLFLVAPTITFQSISTTAALNSIFWFGFGIFCCLTVILFLSLFVFPKLIGNLLAYVCKIPFLKRLETRVKRIGDDIETTALEIRQEKISFWLSSLSATFFSWSSRFLVVNFVLQAFIQLGFIQQIQVFAKQFVLWMFLRVSPTPGGSGVAEWAFGTLLSEYSDSIVLLGAMAVIWRLISYFPYLLIGSLILPKWLSKK